MPDGGFPRPAPTPLSQPFWAAAREGRLVLQRCGACGAYRWTPQLLCIRCRSEDYAWTQVSGRGRIYSATVVQRAPTPAFQVPYVVAVVELVEGPLMLTRLVDCDPAQVEIGQAVEVAFTKLDEEINLYTFRLPRPAA
ncbi:Zn-ribbon domain-containing OB-fold protein [Phenylobacterium sp.]|jgi:hypothetical protein|uniref:Zn-ribbon domain-containing OB-fold protein n=1 Tax=Phenylobacterium sp. TaxID=1871053 RepID=UPI002F40C45F